MNCYLCTTNSNRIGRFSYAENWTLDTNYYLSYNGLIIICLTQFHTIWTLYHTQYIDIQLGLLKVVAGQWNISAFINKFVWDRYLKCSSLGYAFLNNCGEQLQVAFFNYCIVIYIPIFDALPSMICLAIYNWHTRWAGKYNAGNLNWKKEVLYVIPGWWVGGGGVLLIFTAQLMLSYLNEFGI